MDIFFQQILNGLVLGSIYALIALGYTMVYGIMGLINFAHGEVVMIGAMITITVIHFVTGLNLGLPGVAIVLIGLMVAIPLLRISRSIGSDLITPIRSRLVYSSGA